MNTSFNIQLVTLSNGEKILRVEDPKSRLCLERRLYLEHPILPQKARLMELFYELTRMELAAA
jgi:hypothetical protein